MVQGVAVVLTNQVGKRSHRGEGEKGSDAASNVRDSRG